MNRVDISELLAKVVVYDGRYVDEAVLLVWLTQFSEWNKKEVFSAVDKFFEQPDHGWCEPAKLKKIIQDTRDSVRRSNEQVLALQNLAEEDYEDLAAEVEQGFAHWNQWRSEYATYGRRAA